MKFSFFHQGHALSTSLDIFVVRYRVTNFLPKLLNMLLFSMEKKLNFYFFEFPYFRVLPSPQCQTRRKPSVLDQTGRPFSGLDFVVYTNSFAKKSIFSYFRTFAFPDSCRVCCNEKRKKRNPPAGFLPFHQKFKNTRHERHEIS